jgi:TonB-linked SusC/RagA family outer membrane protein
MRDRLFFLLGSLVLWLQVVAQTRTVTGTILDNSGQPLPGVTVRIAGTQTATVTDANGAFSITVPQTARRLELSYVGYATRVVDIPASGPVSVTLQQAETSTLNEVVVTGYSRQRRAEYSGAGTKVTASQVNAIPSGSLDQILQGRSPGLLVTAGSGQPGSNARVQIRGASSISGGSTPLYVVDGVPVEAGVFQAMNPNDIESVDVLRDASATALYGNRGGNGVIVITTKKGRSGATVFGYLGQAGISQPGTQRFSMMNTEELLQFHEKLGRQVNNNLPGWFYSPNNPRNASATPATLQRNAFILDSLRAINEDWQDIFMRTGNFQSHDINLSGGTGKTRFFTSLGYYDEEGIGIRSNMDRFSARSNIDHQTERLTLSLNAYGGFTRRNFIESEGTITLANPFAAAYLGLPYQRLFNPDGTVAVGSGRVGPNAYDRLQTTSDKNNQIKTLVNVSANFQLTQQFNIGGFLGTDFRETTAERQINPLSFAARTAAFPVGPRAATATQTAQPAGGLFREDMIRYFSYLTRGNLGYRNVFAGRHDVDVQTYVEFTRENNRSFNYTGYGINTSLIGTPAGITAGTIANGLIPLVGGERTRRSYFAAIATGRYTFDKKYTLNLSVRRDGTSILPEENRFTTFYSAGATWNVLREPFAANWRTFNDLRFRASYGTSANAAGFPLGTFGYLPTFGSGDYVGGGQLIAPTNAGNPEARWERINTLNLGTDFGVFKNRLTGSLDVYNKITNDNLVTQQLSATSGFASQTINAAKIRNRGVELQLNGEVLRTPSFTWSIGGNVAYNDNEVLDLGQVNEFEQGTSIIRVGLPLGSHYIVEWAGVDPQTGRPLYYDKEGKVTETYSASNAVAEFGTYNAPWIGGFNTGVRFKGFSMDAFFTFQQGFSRFNNQDFFQLNHAFAVQGFNMRREMLNMWSQPGDITDIQSPLYQREFVSKDIQDASYIRFRNLNLSYAFGNNVVSRLKVLGGLRLFLQAQNLYTWTDWTGFDPEDSNNIATYEYPTPRIFTLGVDVNFR